MFLKKSLLLTKPAFIWSKVQQNSNILKYFYYRIDPNIRFFFSWKYIWKKTWSSYIQGLDFDMSIIHPQQ